MTDNKNTFLAIALSAVVLLAWQFFVGMPQMEKQRQQQQTQQQQQKQPSAPPSTAPTPDAPSTAPTPGAPATPGTAPQAQVPATPGGQVFTREAVLAQSPRIAVETPQIKGSIALKG